MAALVLGFFAADYFFVEPRGAFSIDGLATQASMALYVVVGAIILGLARAQRRSQERAKASLAVALSKEEALQKEIAQRTSAEQRVQDFAAELEQRVADRTGEVQVINRQLERQIAEREQADRELLASRDLLEQIINSIPLYIFWKDRNSRYLGCNALFAREAGLGSPREIIGKTDFDLSWKDTADLYRSDDRLVMDTRAPKLNFEEPLGGPDAGSRFIRTSKVPLRDQAGTVFGVLGVFEDITDRKRTEDALRASEEKYRSLFDTSLDGLAFVSLDGRIEDANPAYLRMLGYTLDEVRRMTYQQLTPAKWASMEADIVEHQILTRGYSDEYEKEYIRKDGSVFPIAVRGWSIGSEPRNPTRILGIIRDITERKELLDRLKFQNAMLQTERETSPDGILVVDQTGRFLSWNHRFVEMWHLPAEIMESRSGDRAIAHVAALLKDPASFIAQIQACRKDSALKSKGETRLCDGRTFEYFSSSMIGGNGEQYGRVWFFHDISEIKQTQALLFETRDRLQQALNAGNAGLWSWDIKTQEVYISPSWKAQLGYRDDEIPNRYEEFESRLHPDDHDRICRENAAYLANPSGDYESEFRFRHKNGSYRWFVTRAAVYKNAEGERTWFTGCNFDITERKQSEALLLQVQNRLQLALKAGNAGLWAWDIKTGEVYMSPSWKAQLGYADDEIRNSYEDFVTRVHPDDRERLRKQDEAFLKNPVGECEKEFRIRHKNGSYRWFLGRAALLNNPDGEPTWFTGCNIDITDRKRTETLLLEAQKRLELALRAGNVGLWTWNIQTGKVYFSPTWKAQLGYADDEIPNRFEEWESRIHPEDRARTIEKTMAFSRTPWPDYSIEFRLRHKDGSYRWILVQADVHKDGEGHPEEMLGCHLDITERKQTEMRATRLERMAAMGQLLGGIAHELKNPLFVLSGYLQLFKEKLGQVADDGMADTFRKIEEASKRITMITEHFLHLARPAASQQQLCSVQDALEGTMATLNYDLARNHIALVMPRQAKLPDIWADASLMREVFHHLVMNAIEAMARSHGQGTLTVSTAKSDSWIEVRIQDDGPGIGPDLRTKVFEPFFTTKPPQEGAGLGLWIVRSNLMVLRGSVRLESEPGKGATFIVRLPLLTEPPAAQETA